MKTNILRRAIDSAPFLGLPPRPHSPQNVLRLPIPAVAGILLAVQSAKSCLILAKLISPVQVTNMSGAGAVGLPSLLW